MNELAIYLKAGNQLLTGKEEKLKLALANFLSGGHTLIEDVPGVGKTTLVKFFAQIFDLKLSRIQFTNDLLPSDIIGTSIYNSQRQEFNFHQGPLFGDIIMADELNRAPPKTQSALLQAMEEKHITVDGNTYELPQNFHVIATQNPHAQIGTFDLPESQLDRFSLKMEIGYPDEQSTLTMLKNKSQSLEVDVKEKISSQWINTVKKEVENVYVDDALFAYIYRLLDNSRKSDGFPLSNRSGIDLIKVAKSYAFISNEKSVLPEHIQYIFPYVVGHRLVHPGESNIRVEQDKAQALLAQTNVRA